MQIGLHNFVEWSNRSGYKQIQFPLQKFRENITEKYNFIDNIRIARQILLGQERDSPTLIECTDIKIIVWNWDRDPNKHDYKYFFISKNNDLLIDEPINSAFWLRYFPIFWSSENTLNIKDECMSFYEELNFRKPPIFCGGHSQFAHWISDHLSNFFMSEELNISCNKYLSSKLTAYQNEALTSLNFDGGNSVLSLDIGSELFRVYKCNKLYLIANYGVRDRFDLLRERIAKNYHFLQGEKICYMPRGLIRGQKRISNEEEVINYCEKRGIEIADATYYSFRECINNFSKYSLFISGPSSANTNFSLFSHQNAHFIYGLARSYERPDPAVALGSSWYMLPKLNSTEIIFLEMANEDHSGYDDPVILDISLLESKVAQFTK